MMSSCVAMVFGIKSAVSGSGERMSSTIEVIAVYCFGISWIAGRAMASTPSATASASL